MPMGNFIKKIKNYFKNKIFSKKNDVQELNFEQMIQMGLNPNFHGNNKVHKISIGKNSYVSFNSIIYHSDIGNFCSIGPNVVMGYGDHPLDMISTSPHIYLNDKLFESKKREGILEDHFKKIVIKNDVWIGANVYIKNGVKIGNGAIIGAGSVVLNDVGDYEMVAGVPARLIRNRFNDEVVKLLIKIKWWDLDFHVLKENKETLLNPTVVNLKKMLNKLENDK